MNQLVITIIVILLPGILAAVIFDKITTHSKWGSFKFGLYSLVLGIFCYSSLQLLYLMMDIYSKLTMPDQWSWLSIWNYALTSKDELKATEIFYSSLLSLPVALLASYTINQKLINKLARTLKVSQKFGDENLYSYYLNSKDVNWVYVRDEDQKITYQGMIFSFSEAETYQELVLSEVSVYRTEDSKFLYELPSIYLCRAIGKFTIEAIPEAALGEDK